uniref:Pentraxin (PTX) domain-containing protein n=1 Tax=Neogobius melanostomus TaxID=47308 RepID=A0A8C6V3B0_9GOBI
MALVCIFLSLILGMSAALPQGKCNEMTNLGAVTVCLRSADQMDLILVDNNVNANVFLLCVHRYFTDLTRGTTFFSLATPSHFNAFLLEKFSAKDSIYVSVRNQRVTFQGQDFQLNRWQSLCSTWDAASGLVQLWLDGKPSSMKFITNTNITGPMIIVLGQEQDTCGGGFDINQSFVGMISDVHMWDSVLSPQHIDNYSQKFNFSAGNVLNWKSIEFHIRGRVLVQKDQQC